MEEINKIITEFFDERGWKYKVETEDNDFNYYAVLDLGINILLFHIAVEKDDGRYSIIGHIRDCEISEGQIPAAQNIINEQNLRYAYTRLCIQDKEIFFRVTTRLYNGSYIKSLFEEDIQSFIEFADADFPKIYNQILRSAPANRKQSKGFLSLFKK